MAHYSSFSPDFIGSSDFLDYDPLHMQEENPSLFPSLFPEEEAQGAAQEKIEGAAKRNWDESFGKASSDFKIPTPKTKGGRDLVAKRREEKTERAAKRARIEPGAAFDPSTLQVSDLSFLRFQDLAFDGFNLHPNETYQVRFNIAEVRDKGDLFSFLYKGKINGKSIDFTKAGYSILAREGCCIPLDDGSYQFLLIFTLKATHAASPVPENFLMDIGIKILGFDVWILKGLKVVDKARASPPAHQELLQAMIEEKRAAARQFEAFMRDGSIKSSAELLKALEESHQKELAALSSLLK